MDDLATGASNAPSEPVSTPEAEVSAPPSTREALERAFANVDAGVDAPSDTGKAAAERARDEAGRFAKAEKPAEGDPATPAKAAAAPQDGQEPPAAPETAPAAAGAPQRFSKAAQEAWAQAPEAVRAEVTRMEAELTKGLNEYRQRFEPIKQFDEMARQGGTTLDKALSAYVGMENLIRRDPVAGMLTVCRNAGIDPRKVAEAMTARVGGGQPPQGGEGGQPDPRDAHIAELRREIQRLGGAVNSVGQTVQQQRQQEAMRQVSAEVESFAKDHPRFDELADDIAEMLSTRYAKDLHDAYVKADRLRPAAAQAPAQPATPRAQTPPKASLSITGSPAGGSNPATRKPAGSAREALQNALAQVGF